MPHGSGQDEDFQFAARHPIKARDRTIDMILFAFHALGDGMLFRRDLAGSNPRDVRAADGMIEEAFAPREIVYDDLGRTQMLTPTGETMCPPLAVRLFG